MNRKTGFVDISRYEGDKVLICRKKIKVAAMS